MKNVRNFTDNITRTDIKEQGQLLAVNLPTTKTKKPRNDVIGEKFVKILKKNTKICEHQPW